MGLSSNQQSNAFSKFFIISSETNNDLKLTSPILIHKTILALVGDVKSIKKLNNGNLLIEVLNSKQAENLIKLEKIGNIQVKASPHHTLNHSKGVVSESEFQRDLEEDLLDCLKNQNVIAVKRITIKGNGQIFPTKHLILTFNNPTLPKSVKIAYINCPVKPYIPDPIRCFKCQKFGHTITACRSNKENCARCSLPDHNSQTCKSTTPKCFNCSEARQIVLDRTPKPGISYSSALNSSATPPQVQNSLQIPHLQPTAIRNTSASPTIINPTSDNETITIKKSDWLALLAIKKSWEEKSHSSRISHTPLNPTPTIALPIVPSTDSETNNPVPPTKNSLTIPIASKTTTPTPSTSTLSENNSISEKLKDLVTIKNNKKIKSVSTIQRVKRK
ncbi:hypothetical protein AVEN_105044-1 [Araneus ventricosus]|uniref:CCHC-type domain-containing protein n=1 Tax=Araneus ventricosus TaxID=182803 RepID=A0A4Y2RLD8_ARAVE|nr:hypothetical protein AVEN_105044-1 [Araneus ventricosus]